jgi:3-hydroxyisobutyrate dehydrogenase and related beta-hydroxyacid dehydrogenases
MKLGYIGLGLMGAPCTKNLLKAGYEVHIWARRPESTAPLEKLGAKACASLAEVAKNADIVFLNVSDTRDVEEVIFCENGLAASGKSGLVIVDMGTISATATREMAERLAPSGITLVDAPVSGGTVGAEQGTLTIMVGATEEIFEKIRPVLTAMGRSVTRIGGCGAGQVAKSCNQIAITGTIAAIAEAVKFSAAMEVDFAPIREALLGGFAASRVLELHGKRMMEGNYEPGFKTALHAKDMGIVESIAAELDLVLPVTTLGTDLLRKTAAAGYAEQDSSAMYELIKEMQ